MLETSLSPDHWVVCCGPRGDAFPFGPALQRSAHECRRVSCPATFPGTRDGLHALACFVLAPARKAVTGRIGLRPVPGGFGTPPLPDGSRLLVRGATLIREPGGPAAITTVRAAAELAGVTLAADPGVGSDLPPFEPDRPLAIDEAAVTDAAKRHLDPSRLLTVIVGDRERIGPALEPLALGEPLELAVPA